MFKRKELGRRSDFGRLLPLCLSVSTLALFGSPAAALAQQVDPSLAIPGSTVLVSPGVRYQASAAHRVFSGTGYRDLWVAPVEVEVADLSAIGGGLTPLRLGGGTTTTTLHMIGADGLRYVFRSVDKSPARALPDEFLDTPIEAFVQDQISAFHPSGALVVADLLDHVDVLHTDPTLYVMPDDPVLGEYRETFAGMLVLFEERPDEGQGGAAGFAGSELIVETNTLFDRLREDPLERVDAEEYLRARLVDLLVGDRDRSVNNWRWARIGQEGARLWRPIPRDRDQAFLQLDGLVESVARIYDPRLVTFDESYPSIRGLTRNAWDMDRTFLMSLDRARWDEIVAEVQEALSDEALGHAARRLPQGHYDIVGEELERTLKARRDALPTAADDFYDIVFGTSDVTASDQDDLAVVERLAGGGVRVSLFFLGTDGEPVVPDPYFERTFPSDETREVRLYMWDGDDRVRFAGDSDPGLVVRVIGGDGADVVEDRSRSQPGRVLFYDRGNRSDHEAAPGVEHLEMGSRRPEAWAEKRGTPDWGTRSSPRAGFGYDQDRGVTLAGGWVHKRYGFRKDPFDSRLGLSLAYSVGLNRFRLDYRHEFREVTSRLDLEVNARLSGMEIIHFYGLGNETQSPGSDSFHRVVQQGFLLLPAGVLNPDGAVSVSVAPVVKVFDTDTTSADGSIIGEARPYGSGRFSQVGARVGLNIRGGSKTPAEGHGFRLTSTGSWYPSLLDVASDFGIVDGEITGYLLPWTDRLALLGTLGGQWNLGTAPFHEYAFLGGRSNLRSYQENRFAGDAMVYLNAEARAFLGRVFLFFPFDVGLVGLADVGRVFVDGEDSSKWHPAYGGGILVAPFTRTNLLTLSMVWGDEGGALYIGTEFGF